MPGSKSSTLGAPSQSGRVRAFLASAHFAKMWRYMTVSVITTILTLGMLYFFWRVVNVPAVDVHGWVISQAEVANVIATAISTIPSYYLNRTWAWGKTGKSHVWREVVPFWVIAFISLVLSTYVVGLASREAVHLSSTLHLSHRHEVQTVLGELGNLATYAVMWLVKYFIFNRLLFIGGERTGRGEPLATISPEATPTSPNGEHRELVTTNGVHAEAAPTGTRSARPSSARPSSAAGDVLLSAEPAADAG